MQGKRIRFLAVSVFAAMMLCLFSEGILVREVAASPALPALEVRFSHRSGFFSEDFDLVLSAPEGAMIFYTLNGLPTSQCSVNEHYTRPPTAVDLFYTAPIHVIAGGTVDVFTIRAFAARGNEVSEVVTRSFVKGSGVDSRFCENTLIFVLNTDPHGLHDHHDGVFEFGIDRENWRQQQFDRTGRWPTRGWNAPAETPAVAANFNRRGEVSARRAYLDMFEHDGTLRLSQNIEMRVKGGFSRSHTQKTLELYARDEAGEWEFFDYPFFRENSADGNIMNRYRRVRLRNGGSDRHGAFVRDELSHALLGQAGLPNVQNHTPAAIFINGEYYGVAWVKTPRTENNLRRRFGGETANFRALEGSENGYGSDFWEGEDDAIADWRDNVFHYATRDGGRRLTDDSRWEIFQSRVCIDNLLLYYAFNIYTQNLDWPNHNMEMWRYFPTDDELNDPDLHPYLRDGRWRWMPHDLEAAWAANGATATANSIHNYIVAAGPGAPNWQGTSALLRAVLQRPEVRIRFANTLVDLIEGACAPANVERTLGELTSRISREHDYALARGRIASNWPHYPEIFPISASDVPWSRTQITAFANARPEAMLGFIGRDWGAMTNSGLGYNRNARAPLTVTTSAGGGAVMNSRPLSESSTAVGNYYSGSAVRVTAKPYPGYEVSHWIVNGTRREASESVTVNITNQPLEVGVHFVKVADGNLRVTLISATRDDRVEIHNPTDGTLTTRGLYLSDSGSNLQKWRLPHLVVRAGETVTIRMSNNDSDDTLKWTQTNFNLSFRENLRLVDAKGNVLQSAEVTLMRRDQVQRLGRDGNWRLERDSRLPPPDPTPTVYAPVRLMAQDTVSWTRRESPVVRINGNGVYTATLTLPPSENLVSLALMSDGASFAWPEGFTGVSNAPANWGEARVRFESVAINGVTVGIDWGDYLVRRGDDAAGGGRVNLELWGGWWEANQRLTGVASVPTYGDSTSFAMTDGSAMISIEVQFRVSGIPA